MAFIPRLKRVLSDLQITFRRNMNKNLEDIEGGFKKVDQTFIVHKTRIDNLVLNASDDTNMEMIDARVDSKGKQYNLVGERLNEKEIYFENEITTRTELFKEESLLITAFGGTNGNQLDLYLTYDGKELIALNTGIIFEPPGGYLRDPSIIQWNNAFYLCYTTNIGEGVKGFGISKSFDLNEWEHWTVEIPGSATVWAPEWFVEGNNVYIAVSLGDGTTQADIDGRVIPYMVPHYMKADNAELTHFTTPRPIKFSKSSNKIDPQFFGEDGQYYMFVKNEYSKEIEKYSANVLPDQEPIWTYQQTIPFPVPVEGPYVVQFKEDYLLFADGFRTLNYFMSSSSDLGTWSDAIKIEPTNGVNIRHFSVLKVTDEIKSVIEGFSRRRMLENISFQSKIEQIGLNKYPLKDYLVNGKFSPPQFNAYYIVDGSADPKDYVITEIVPPDNSGQKGYFYFALQVPSTNTLSSVVIRNGNNILTPNNADIVLSTYAGTNEMILKIETVGQKDPKFRVVNFVNNRPSQQRLLLQDYVKNNVFSPSSFDAYYVVNGESQVSTTLEQIVVPNNDYSYRMRIAIALQVSTDNTTHKIIIKNKNNILTPNNQDFEISTAKGNNEVIFVLECPGKSDQRFRFVNMFSMDQSNRNFVTLNKAWLREQVLYLTEDKEAKVDLSSIAVGGVIDSLLLKDQQYYVVSGTNSVTIKDFDTTLIGAKKASVFFCVESNTDTAGITFKNGTYLKTPAGEDLVLNKVNKNTDTIYEFTKQVRTYTQFRLKR